jgi:dihydrofolate synthase/folylpolyglutamate synthase
LASRPDPIEFLFGLEILGMKFGLENIQALCAALGHPERAFSSVIVAGTNGKGSVTAMVSAALDAAGRRVARYTSPHLERIEERFTIAEEMVTTASLRDAAGVVQAAVERLLREGVLEMPPTFFECTTAVAFELFRQARVEIAVLEVGLGGRLDATNVVTPVAAAITSVDLDHQAQLGSTIAEVAREKAGVIKQGVPVVVGPVAAAADRVIAEVAESRDARVVRVGEEIRVTSAGGRAPAVTIDTPSRHLPGMVLSLAGRHQAANAGVAVGVLDELARAGVGVNDDAAIAGLTNAVWPGRLERFRFRGRDVLIDAAHNPAGARALAAYLHDEGWQGATLLFGAMRDKDVAGMLTALLPACGALVATTAPSPRAMRASQIAAIAAEISAGPANIEAIDDPAAALARACQHSSRVVAAGSMFLIGPLRGILR